MKRLIICGLCLSLAPVLFGVAGCQSSAPVYPETAPLAHAYPKGANRARLRVPGASTEFPEVPTQYVAKRRLPYRLVVAPVVDRRPEYYGQPIAGTKWTAVRTDALWSESATGLMLQRLVNELRSSGLFAEVSEGPARPGDLVLKCEVRAFCSQARGFLFVRVAGMSALQIDLEQDGRLLLRRKFENVVTDGDKDYTGSQVTFLEQAMRVTMADSLCGLLKTMFEDLEENL